MPHAIADAGVLIPSGRTQPDPATLTLDEMNIDIIVDNGDATVAVRQIYGSHSGDVLEGSYSFTLPSRALVSDFAVWDGVTRIPGVILERRRAEEIYNNLKWQAIDPGLLQQGERGEDEARRSSSFTARVVPIPPFGTKRVELEYHERITVEDLQSLLTIALRPEAYAAQLARQLTIQVDVKSQHPLTDFQQVGQLYPLQIAERTANHIRASFTGQNIQLTEDFALRWKLDPAQAGKLQILAHRAGEPTGYFQAQALLTPAPETPAEPRTVVVLFDTSLSMQWEKLERSFLTLETTLRSLRPSDRFRLILFNTELLSFSPAPVAAEPATVEKALAFVRASRLRSGTDLQAALEAGLKQAVPGAYLVLLSDGGATRGAIANGKLAAWYAARWKTVRPRTYVFGSGDDANLPLLRMLAANDGYLECVRSTEPADFKIKAFVNKIGRRPVEGLTFTAQPTSNLSLIYPLEPVWFPGSMPTWVGQYHQPGSATFAAAGMTATTNLPARSEEHPQLPRTWAKARVDALLEKIERDGEDRATIDEVIRLARKYKFVTPYTSFLAAPRSLLRPRLIRPGDPVLRVRTDSSVKSVVALFPFGLMKRLRYLEKEDIWQTRFLAPVDLDDGTHTIRLVLRDQSGRIFRETKTFVIASKPPVVRVALDKIRYLRGETVRMKVSASASTRTITARLYGAMPSYLHWNQSLASNTGQLVVPAHGGALVLHADIATYLRNLEASNPIQDVFFRLVPVGSVSIRMRRPPAETVPALTGKINQAPSDAELRAFRAWESERALRFEDAEKDWQEYARLATSKATAYTALADYYSRRIMPEAELGALGQAAVETNPISERFTAPAAQRSWMTFQRMLNVVEQQALPADRGLMVFRAWQQRYPEEPSILRRLFQYLTAKKRLPDAEALIAEYQAKFRTDEVFPVQARASLATSRGSDEQALAVYDQNFRPLWPPELIRSYFELLGRTHSLRRFLAEARSATASRPDDIVPAARLFYYWQQQGNLASARRALLEYGQRKSGWTPGELRISARLFEGVNSHDDAAHAWYALYTLQAADNMAKREALAELARLLLAAPDQPIRIGTGDLSLYSDIATADPHPGFLNGVLSLLLNSTYPRTEFATQEQSGISYFHRAKAAALIGLLDQRFPDAPELAALHADLLQAYSTYGISDAVIKGSKEFLAQFPKSPERTRVALLQAEAYARKQQVAEELAVYNSLLQELGAQAGHVPLGQAISETPPSGAAAPGSAESRTARSPEYARVLDRYLARLVSLKRLPEALQVYRQELQRNPDDPGLYERFAAFIEQNKLGAEVEIVYQSAIGQFHSRAWYERLARWYLRQKRREDFSRLADQVTKIFSGSDLEQYISGLVTPNFDAVLYRQVNLFANQRFPNNLTFVRNLLDAYSRPATRDAISCQRLLRNYWYFDTGLRERYFESLSRGNQLPGAIAAVEKNAPSPATARWLGEAEAWRSHFEEAAPA
ncbi:MAG: VIT domain-containing protein [Acidobacteria bacterium]|nr:VIT domain-containing protein [Acidobacteriota bacterium]